MSQDNESTVKETPIYKRFPPPLGYSKNPTDWNIDAFSSPYEVDEVKNDEPFYSKEWQKKTANDAKDIGGIRLYELVFIMAKEKCYSKILPDLWDYSGLNDDGRQRFPKWEQSFAATRQSRSWGWYWLLCRWTIFEKFIDDGNQPIESYYFSHLKKISLLPLYDYTNGKFKLKKEEDQQSPKQYIKLDEFEEYLKKIEGISIPLPALLDPKQKSTSKSKKLRQDQKDKKAVQNVARNIWNKEKLKIGIKEMCSRDEILNAGGKHYQPRTRHKWVSEVAPLWAKQPGRRKGT